MDEDDIHNWYDEQKQLLFEAYEKQLFDGADRDKASEEYTKKIEKLVTDYRSKIDTALTKAAQRAKIKKQIKELVAKLPELHKKKKDDENS